MPYPRTFSPSALCTVFDDYGAFQANCPVQVFKPLLAYSTNGPQSKITGFTLPNQAGIILRALVSVLSPGVSLKPGPAYWSTGKVPYMVFNEDPNALQWRWSDAFPWTLDTSHKLWSVFAEVNSPPPPPPPPPTPVTLGTTSGTATALTAGVVYTTTLAGTTGGWGYVPFPSGTAYTVSTLAGTGGSVGTAAFGGSPASLGTLEGTQPTSPSSFSVVGSAHVGPDTVLHLLNTLIGTQTAVFQITSP